MTAGFKDTIDTWINAVEQTSLAQLCTKPSNERWSLGQVCMHLIEATNFYCEQINICLAGNENATEEMSPAAKTFFENNGFSDAIIEGPETNAGTPQPESKEVLLVSLNALKEKLIRVENSIAASPCIGKSKHPGLNYFNAKEWLQFAEMHFRHHVRQKNRIEDFLKNH